MLPSLASLSSAIREMATSSRVSASARSLRSSCICSMSATTWSSVWLSFWRTSRNCWDVLSTAFCPSTRAMLASRICRLAASSPRVSAMSRVMRAISADSKSSLRASEPCSIPIRCWIWSNASRAATVATCAAASTRIACALDSLTSLSVASSRPFSSMTSPPARAFSICRLETRCSSASMTPLAPPESSFRVASAITIRRSMLRSLLACAAAADSAATSLSSSSRTSFGVPNRRGPRPPGPGPGPPREGGCEGRGGKSSKPKPSSPWGGVPGPRRGAPTRGRRIASKSGLNPPPGLNLPSCGPGPMPMPGGGGPGMGGAAALGGGMFLGGGGTSPVRSRLGGSGRRSPPPAPGGGGMLSGGPARERGDGRYDVSAVFTRVIARLSYGASEGESGKWRSESGRGGG